MADELAGKVAVVTGGAAGLGRGIVELFVEEGARVVVADVDECGTALAAGIGPAAAFVRTDVSDPAQVRALVGHTVEVFGGLDVMVNNAGVPSALGVGLLDDDFADFHRVMAVNVLGMMVGTQQAARHMARHGGGSVINLTSIAALQAGTGVLSYRASKAAAAHVSRSMALEVARLGVRVNCIAPGMVPTALLGAAGGEGSADEVARIRERMAAVRPLPDAGTARDVADAALYLAGDRSRYVTGTVLTVDGGTSIGSPPREHPGHHATGRP